MKRLLKLDPKVVQRFLGLRSKKLGRSLARFVMRRVIRFKERKRQALVESALKEVVKVVAQCHRYKLKDALTIYNLALFFLIAERDIQAAKLDALTHPDPWVRTLSCRVILLTLHELDMDKVAGNRLKDALNSIPSEELKTEFIQAMRGGRKVQQTAQKEFYFLRNTTIAHRESDALLQYRSILAIDEFAVFKIANEYYSAAEVFIQLLPFLMQELTSITNLVAQLSKAEGFAQQVQ